MPVLLTTPYTPEGVTDPQLGAPRAKITMVQINLDGEDNPQFGKGRANAIHARVSFGDVVAGKWVDDARFKARAFHIAYDDFVTAIAETTDASYGHLIYEGIKRWIWAFIQAEEPSIFAGTIE